MSQWQVVVEIDDDNIRENGNEVKVSVIVEAPDSSLAQERALVQVSDSTRSPKGEPPKHFRVVSCEPFVSPHRNTVEVKNGGPQATAPQKAQITAPAKRAVPPNVKE